MPCVSPDARNYVGFNASEVKRICSNPSSEGVLVSSSLSFYGYTSEVQFKPEDLANWCEICVQGGVVDDATFNSHFTKTVGASRNFDWLALLFASFMVAVKPPVTICSLPVLETDSE